MSDSDAAGPAPGDDLAAMLYDELRQLAARKLAREKPGQTLDATALVHEAYLRLAADDARWENRGHFFAAAAEAMRRILVDKARRKKALKHGGGRPREDLDADAIVAPGIDDDLTLNEALERLERCDPVKASLVKLRYFSGLTIPQAAEALGLSTTTADRYWSYARAWLRVEIEGSDDRVV